MGKIKVEGYIYTTADEDTDKNIKMWAREYLCNGFEDIRRNPPLSEKGKEKVSIICEEMSKPGYCGPSNMSGYPKVDWAVTVDIIEK